MLDYVVITGDTCVFNSTFSGGAVVTAAPTIILGSALDVKINGKAVCIVGDELTASVVSAVYVSPPYNVPGTGVITIGLLPNQISSQSVADGKNMIKVGTGFIANFTVTSPAMSSAPSPDPVLSKTGTGYFVTTNTLVRTT